MHLPDIQRLLAELGWYTGALDGDAGPQTLAAMRMAEAGHADKARVSLNVHGYVGEDGKAAADLFFPAQKQVMDQIGRERGWGPQSRAQFDASMSPEGAMFVGDPNQVADKILGLKDDLGFDRVSIQMAIGVIDHAEMLKAIEVLGTKVAPLLRAG